jgi:hypothetical protein
MKINLLKLQILKIMEMRLLKKVNINKLLNFIKMVYNMLILNKALRFNKSEKY